MALSSGILLLLCFLFFASSLPHVKRSSDSVGRGRDVRSVSHASTAQIVSSLQIPLCSKNDNVVPRSCYDAKQLGHTISGVYEIDPRDGLGSFKVYCDMETDGGGWTVFQRRKDGSVDFYRNWNDYKEGFGELHGEFWLGLEKIHRLSVDVNLRVDLMAFDDSKAYAQYEDFTVGDESSKYVLYFGRYTGTTGDSWRSHNVKGMKFSTKDSDNDKNGGSSCAATMQSGWWYNGCQHSNLNGRYTYGGTGSWTYVVWYAFKGTTSLQKSEMKVRNA